MKKKIDVRMLALCGMLAAVCFVLGQVSGILDFQSVKVTLEGLPVLIAALMYGPVAGMAVGGIGTFISQCLGKYGLTVTTPLWILPYFIAGLVVGFIAMKKKYTYSMIDYFWIITVSEVIITAINSLGIYIASNIEGWYYPGIILGNLAVRLLIMVAKILIYSFMVPNLIKIIRRVDHKQYQ
ncbi:MAG: folate family ECF transporter S component [Lachnospiraceae bacterium]|nr:folate family ECF transporter S component [Lachnospiraceae bacterium]MBR0434513.1 folate family ECF transporter S component [Lachnospiraceae bacterium]